MGVGWEDRREMGTFIPFFASGFSPFQKEKKEAISLSFHKERVNCKKRPYKQHENKDKVS